MAYSTQQVAAALKAAGFNRAPTTQDITNANKYGLGIFAKTSAKIFNAPQNPVVPLAEHKVISDIVGAVNQPKTEEQLLQEAQGLYGPYFQQQGQDLQSEYGTDIQRLDEDLAFQMQQQELSRGQNIGALNQRFGEAYGSPLSQKLYGQQEDVRRQQLIPFTRKRYDLGEILRKQKQESEYSRQQAFGQYTSNPLNIYSGILTS